MIEKSKRELIIEAAYHVFGSKGFQGAKMEEIADKAGVGKGTLYEYFQSKKNLYEEMYHAYMEKYFNNLGKNIENESTATNKVRLIIINHLFYMQKAKGLFMILEADHNSAKDLSPKIKKQLNNIYTDNHKQVVDIINAGINAGEFRKMDASLAANFLLSSITGMGHYLMFLKTDFDLEEVAGRVLDLFINGMKKQD